MKRKIKTLLASLLILAMLVQTFVGVELEVKADEKTEKIYKEMSFGDWTEKGTTGIGARKYELTDKTAIASLDGVAISGKVNFNGTKNKYLTFGGTDTITHGGFWIKVSGEGALSLMCQGVDGVQSNEVKISNAAFKLNEEFILRVTFDYDTTNKTWTMTVYANSTLLGSDTFDFSSATADLGLYIGIPKEFTVDMTPSNTEQTYTELKFSDWGKEAGLNGRGYNKYELTDASSITSLDGVAISGKVNFNGELNQYLIFGGTEKLDYAGFWIKTAGEGKLELTCQGVGGVTNVTGIGHQFSNEAFKINEEFTLRVTFDYDEANKTWSVRVYADGTRVASNKFDFSTATESLKLYLGVPTEFTMDIYTEMMFGDWTENKKTARGDRKYQPTDSATLTSLDGVAINGKVNFNGITNKYLTFGGTDKLDYAGLWIKVSGEGALSLMCQGVEGVSINEVRINNAAFKLNEEFTLRVSFDYNSAKKTWTMTVYADGTLLGSGTFDFSSTTESLKLYIGIPTEFTVDMTPTGVGSTYTEMKFGDWSNFLGGYTFEDYTTHLYALSEDSSITSLDDIAISGTINFNEMKNHTISIGGTDDYNYAGFWLRATQEDTWNLSAQGIGKGAATTMSSKVVSYDKDIALRMTFNEIAINTWIVCVYADGICVGSKTFEGVTPGLYIGIPEDMTVEGKNTVYELSGTEITYEESGTTYYVGETVSQDKSKRVVVYKTGDANKDVICNVADLVRMKKYTTELETARIEYTLAAKLASDFDKDSQLSDIDTKLLREYILLNGELGK